MFASPRLFPSFLVDLIAQVVSPAPRDVWERVANADPFALVTQTAAWIDTMTEAGGWLDASRFYTMESGRQLVLPIARRRSRARLGVQSSFPTGWGMGGVLAEGGPTSGETVAVLTELTELGVIRSSVRPNPLLADVWDNGLDGLTVLPKRSHVLDLTGGAEAVWNERFTQSGRRGVRRAERADLEIVHDEGGALVPVFYDLFLKSLERWAERSREPVWMALARGKLRDPQVKFEIMARRLGDAFRLYVAYSGGQPAASILVLIGANAHYTRGAMDVDIVGKSGANDLLHWTAIQAACEAGCKSYHMGETGTSGSLAQYKEKLGATSIDYSIYRTERVPLTSADRVARETVKKLIGFRDAGPNSR